MKQLKYIAFLFIIGLCSNNIWASSRVALRNLKQDKLDMPATEHINTERWMLEFNLTSEISVDQSSQKCCNSKQDSTKIKNTINQKDSVKIEDWMLNRKSFYVGFKNYGSKEPEWLITHDFFIL
ncbi:MAG: hypothetical protein MI739_04850 [Bacteroidales bacterium]|nr:hypothetical protein [Bacteroidales bacterium]